MEAVFSFSNTTLQSATGAAGARYQGNKTRCCSHYQSYGTCSFARIPSTNRLFFGIRRDAVFTYSFIGKFLFGRLCRGITG